MNGDNKTSRQSLFFDFAKAKSSTAKLSISQKEKPLGKRKV